MNQPDPSRYGQTTVRRWMIQFEEAEANPEGIPAHYILQADLEANIAYDVPQWVKDQLRTWVKERYPDIPLWRVNTFTGDILPNDPAGWAIWHWKHQNKARHPGVQLPLL